MLVARTTRLVHEILKYNVAEHPDKIALVCDGKRLTYAEIDATSDRLANALHQSGVKRGDRVLICLPNCVEAVVGVFASLKANAVFTVIDAGTRFERLSHIAADCQPTALIAGSQNAALASRLVAEAPSLRVAVLTGEGAITPQCGGATFLTFDGILNDFVAVAPPTQAINSDLAYLIYTSGSTGEPKGVMITHRSALFAIDIDIEYLGLSGADVIIDILPLSFGYGFHQLLKAFRVGGRLVLEQSFVYPNLILARIEAERVTGFPCIPTMFAHLFQADLDRYDLTSLRYFSSMGAALAPSLIRKCRDRFPGVAFFSMYSQTEACNALGLDPAEIDRHAASVGKPLPGTEAWLVDDNDRRLAPGEVGELVVAGGHVRSGYWNSPELSAIRFRRGKLPEQLVCYTGDMFRMDEQGYFYFVGRSDEVVKIAGRKVSPRQVEDALYRLPGVREAAVIGVADPTLGYQLKAFVVTDDSAEPRLTEAALLSHCGRTLERYMVPRWFELRDQLPKTANGKIRKAELT